MNKITEICCSKQFRNDDVVSIFLENVLATVKILSLEATTHFGIFYKVEILEYPAEKVIKYE